MNTNNGSSTADRRLLRSEKTLSASSYAPSSCRASPSIRPASARRAARAAPPGRAARPGTKSCAPPRQPGRFDQELGFGRGGGVDSCAVAIRIGSSRRRAPFASITSACAKQQAPTRQRRHARAQHSPYNGCASATCVPTSVGRESRAARSGPSDRAAGSTTDSSIGNSVGSHTASTSRASRASGPSSPTRASTSSSNRARGDQRTGQLPHAVLLDELTALERAEHQLP